MNNRDATTDPSLRSFLPVHPHSHFPIQNLPYGAFRTRANGEPRIGVAIGDQILDLAVLESAGLVRARGAAGPVFGRGTLNAFMALGRSTWREVRATISRLLRDDVATLRDDAALRARALVPQADAEMLLPAAIANYTDFYSSREHATNVGIMFRGVENALMPNWLHLPVAYHGRASTVVVSGRDVVRPKGQTKADDAPSPSFGPTKLLDFELEVGFLVGPPSEIGRPIEATRAEEHVFGLVLVNDWSARDVQKWEYQPLGPFTAKNFLTSISPWVVTLEALEPFRCGGPAQNPEPLPYLRTQGSYTFDITLEVLLETTKLAEPHRICRSNYRLLYWNLSQQLAHHTVTGCNVCTGDLMASGTISGPTPDSFGSLLELAWRGTKPLALPSGEARSFLQDGDAVTMTGWCEAPGHRVGFGEVRGRVIPASSG
jgi:fumarylacetoacetase